MKPHSPLTVGRCMDCRKPQEIVRNGHEWKPCACGGTSFWEVVHYPPMKRPGSWRRSVRRLALKHSLFFFFGHLIALLAQVGFLLTQWIGRGVWLEMAATAFTFGLLVGALSMRSAFED